MPLKSPKAQIIGLILPENIDLVDGFQQCDLLELRFDLFPRTEWDAALMRVKEQWPSHPLIATIRLQRDGGAWPDVQREEREPFLEVLATSGSVEWIDAELQYPEWARRLIEISSKRTKILISSHDLKGSPGSLAEYEEFWKSATALKGDGIKLVVTFPQQTLCANGGDKGASAPNLISRERDLYTFIEHHRDDPRLLAAFAMGEAGRATRIESVRRGAPWCYGFVGRHAPAAGQWSVHELQRLFAKLRGPNMEG